MNTLYPLKFKPFFLEKIWGGQKLKTSLGLNFAGDNKIGEAWMLSGVPGAQTRVSNGFLKGNEINDLLEVYMDELIGEKAFIKHREVFPLLIKFIDANDWLSVQVHPDDMLASKRKLPGGKTEMWYIMDAEPGAELITGFNRKISREFYLKNLTDKTLPDILNYEQVKKGDVFYIPSGRVHALGPGLLLAEIQQTSDTTYRIYDWDRIDQQGKSRAMHTSLALDAIDYTVPSSYRSTYTASENKSVNLVQSPFFHTNLLDFRLPVARDYSELDSFVIYLCVEGNAELAFPSGKEKISKGEVLLIPAIIDKMALIPQPACKILEVFGM